VTYWKSVDAPQAFAGPTGDMLPRTVARPAVSAAGVAVAIGTVAIALLVAAAVAGHHPGAVHALRSACSVVATAVALRLLSVAVFGAYAALVAEESEEAAAALPG
jgi:hypothetical protein